MVAKRGRRRFRKLDLRAGVCEGLRVEHRQPVLPASLLTSRPRPRAPSPRDSSRAGRRTHCGPQPRPASRSRRYSPAGTAEPAVTVSRRRTPPRPRSGRRRGVAARRRPARRAWQLFDARLLPPFPDRLKLDLATHGGRDGRQVGDPYSPNRSHPIHEVTDGSLAAGLLEPAVRGHKAAPVAHRQR
jgi:hypothetical protein